MKARYVLLLAAVAALAVFGVSSAFGGVGNNAPDGTHYTLNIHGVAKGQGFTNSGTKNNIFVPLYGNCKIDLQEGSFQVISPDCVNSNALFQLPAPGTSADNSYSVYVATRGKPLGSATEQTCFTDSSGTQYCSIMILTLSRSFGQDKYQNVTKDLLYAYVCQNDQIKAVPLFSDSTSQWYWQYDNNGLRLASLRFYPGVYTAPASGSCTPSS